MLDADSSFLSQIYKDLHVIFSNIQVNVLCNIYVTKLKTHIVIWKNKVGFFYLFFECYRRKKCNEGLTVDCRTHKYPIVKAVLTFSLNSHNTVKRGLIKEQQINN